MIMPYITKCYLWNRKKSPIFKLAESQVHHHLLYFNMVSYQLYELSTNIQYLIEIYFNLLTLRIASNMVLKLHVVYSFRTISTIGTVNQ